MILGQSNLLKSSVLVIGAGGLGSPALLYLAACGVGRLGIIDHDVVELNNMHRQVRDLRKFSSGSSFFFLAHSLVREMNKRYYLMLIVFFFFSFFFILQVIHTEAFIGHPKVKSAATACRSINSTIKIDEYVEALRTSNALEILSQYDIIVDATDNPPSRYMISDCCVLLGKPLVSGAALGMEGQLTVYNHKGGPCYRCLFPTPPPTTACQRCSDSGVLGVVPGAIGCLQALETIKLASMVGEPLSERMLLFDALSARIRIVKIRGRSAQCTVCGDNSSFNKQQFKDFDYEEFTQFPLSAGPLNLLPEESRISSKEFKEILQKKERHVLLDVRPSHHYKIVSFPDSLNIPFANLEARLNELTSALKEKEDGHVNSGSCANPSLYVVCRRGNDSQRAVQYLRDSGFSSAKDIIGGLEAWAADVNPNFPSY
ncbi:hypothetical protein DY000_02017168 [Brassica cretica]|uniref:Rhodanese domain-containing protein n=1 Tax=Brassica cretica TaxID=69181 RepID=A0ABQ7D4I9_BRACR|nr:hypothetical protein DY000_02017168 [Brassica cretica]